MRNLAQTSLERDTVFSDGYGSQLAAGTGDVTAGMRAALTMRSTPESSMRDIRRRPGRGGWARTAPTGRMGG